MNCGDGSERRRGGEQVGSLAAQHGAEQPERAAMGDYDRVRPGGAEVVGDRLHAAEQRRAAFAAGRGEPVGRAGPGVQCGPVDLVPAPAFPDAEMQFQQPGINRRMRRKPVGDRAAAAGGAGEHAADPASPKLGDELGQGGLAGGAQPEVEPAVAAAGLDRGLRMTDQEDAQAGRFSAVGPVRP